MPARITFNYRSGLKVRAALGMPPLISARFIVGVGTPSPDVENYWIDDSDSPVCTDLGELTIIDDVIFYWEGPDGDLVCDDAGETVELLHINN